MAPRTPKSSASASPSSDFNLRNDLTAVLGDTGLKRYGGFVSEESLKELQGGTGVRLFGEMADNHTVLGGVLFAITYLLRSVPWSVESASDLPEHIKAADFVSSCLDDMAQTWQTTITEILSFIQYGFSYHEVCYKLRSGDNDDTRKASRYDDGMIGWAGFPIRSQDSLYKWEFDPDGNVMGMHQQVVNTDLQDDRGWMRYIPLAKAVHFTTDASKNNPHGRSVLRSCVTTYLKQRKIEEIECIGIERDLAGFPVITMPSRIMNKNAGGDDQALYAQFKTIVSQIRRDATEGMCLPSDCYPNTSIPMFELKLLNSGGSRQFNTTEIIQRNDTRMATSMLADFMSLGHGASQGSQALAGPKMEMFNIALRGFLDIVAEQLNRGPIVQLLKLNGFDVKETPTLKHGDIEHGDLDKLGAYINSLAGAGMPLFPDPALEAHLRQQADLPEPSADYGREVGTGGGDDVNDASEQSRGASQDGVIKGAGFDESKHPRDVDGKFSLASGLVSSLYEEIKNLSRENIAQIHMPKEQRNGKDYAQLFENLSLDRRIALEGLRRQIELETGANIKLEHSGSAGSKSAYILAPINSASQDHNVPKWTSLRISNHDLPEQYGEHSHEWIHGGNKDLSSVVERFIAHAKANR